MVVLFVCMTESQFEYCVDFIHQHKQAWKLPTQAEQLQIYGLFQQIVSGNIDQPEPAKNTLDHAIWHAHAQHTDKSATQCMHEYVDLIKSIALRYDQQKHNDNTTEHDMVQLYKKLNIQYPPQHNDKQANVTDNNESSKQNGSTHTNYNDFNHHPDTDKTSTNNSKQHDKQTNGHTRNLSEEHSKQTEQLAELSSKIQSIDTNGVSSKAEQLQQHTQLAQDTLNNLVQQNTQHINSVKGKSQHVSDKLSQIDAMHHQLVEKFAANNITDRPADDTTVHTRSTLDTVTDALSIGLPLLLGAYALYTTYSNRKAVRR